MSDEPRNKAYAKKGISTTSILTDFHFSFAIISFNSLHWQKGIKSIVHLLELKRQCSSICLPIRLLGATTLRLQPSQHTVHGLTGIIGQQNLSL